MPQPPLTIPQIWDLEKRVIALTKELEEARNRIPKEPEAYNSLGTLSVNLCALRRAICTGRGILDVLPICWKPEDKPTEASWEPIGPCAQGAMLPESQNNRPFNVLYKGWWVIETNGPAITSSPTRERAAVYQGPGDEEFWFRMAESVEFVPLGEEPGGAFSASRARRDSVEGPAAAAQPALEPLKLLGRVLTALEPFQPEIRNLIHEATKHAR